jgi:ATP-dependent Lon protease
LEREIASVCRKTARKVAEGKRKQYKITSQNVETYLGPPKIFKDQVQKKDQIGVCTGLAWTEAGGEILFVEAMKMAGKGGLSLTGSLGEVMKESAHAALSYARAHAKALKINPRIFSQNDFHIHIPEGAIPKDGPSAGITMATALISVCTDAQVRWDTAMTGEITLRGTVLPIGGVKEKVLAAQRAGIFRLILPAANRKDLFDIPKVIKKEMEFVFVEEIGEVLKAALVPKTRKKKK